MTYNLVHFIIRLPPLYWNHAAYLNVLTLLYLELESHVQTTYVACREMVNREIMFQYHGSKRPCDDLIFVFILLRPKTVLHITPPTSWPSSAPAPDGPLKECVLSVSRSIYNSLPFLLVGMQCDAINELVTSSLFEHWMNWSVDL